MKIGRNCALYSGSEYKAPWKITVGDCSSIASGCIIDGRRGVSIGRNVTIAFNVMIWSLQHDVNSHDFTPVGSEVSIEDNVWLASSCIILPGIKVGKGAVVASGSVVTKDVDEYSVVAGNPARVVGKRNKNLDYCSGKWELPFV